MESKGIREIYSDCDPKQAEDKSLPTNSFLIEYLQDGVTKFDIVASMKKVEIFDHYWDNYRHDLKNITQTDGRINPRLWNSSTVKKGKK